MLTFVENIDEVFRSYKKFLKNIGNCLGNVKNYNIKQKTQWQSFSEAIIFKKN